MDAYQTFVLLVVDHQTRALSNSTLGRAGGKTANQILASTAGLVNGKASQQTFGILNRSAESIGINEEYRGWFNGGTLVGQSDPSSASFLSSGSSPSLAFASSGSSVVTQVANVVPIAMRIGATLLANAVQGEGETSGSSEVTVNHDGADVPIYRGGESFELKPNEFRLTPNGKYPARGLSLEVNPDRVKKYGGAFRLLSIPDELQMIHTPSSNSSTHFDIIPRNLTPGKGGMEELQRNYQELLKKIKISPTPHE